MSDGNRKRLVDDLSKRIAKHVVEQLKSGMAGSIEPYLPTGQVAKLMGLSVATLESYRAKGLGPRYFKCGGNVRYLASDVKAWVEENSEK